MKVDYEKLYEEAIYFFLTTRRGSWPRSEVSKRLQKMKMDAEKELQAKMEAGAMH